MGAKICCLCQDNLALEPTRSRILFGRSYVDSNGDSPCIDCILEIDDAQSIAAFGSTDEE